MKFLSIYKKLLEDINGGIYKQGDSLPTLKELIKRFGVSKTAIDNALRILVRDGVIKRVRSQGTFVRSMPGKSILDSTRQSRILFLGKGTLEGLIVDDFANRTVLGINNVLIKTNRSLHFIALRRISAAEALAIIDAIKPAGVILFAIYDKEIINGLKERKMPAVCLDTVDHSIPLQQ
ncbi:MAG: GntR family transcriptional regulator, partial [Fibrobacteres bacterium]|nr:GntR family transcriptional regulator [Fibrobacterota bacterium]